MRALWQSLHSALAKATIPDRFQQQFKRLRESHPALRPFRDAADLLDHLRAPDGDRDGKDAILEALIGAAQMRQETSEAAATLLWLGLWPGLDALYRRLVRHFLSAPDELVSEIAERFTGEIHRIDPHRVRRIAATLLLNVERDIRDALSRRWSEAAIVQPLPEVEIAVADLAAPRPLPAPSLLGVPPWLCADAATAILMKRLRACPGVDADLVVAVSVHGESQAEAGARRGLAIETARKRYRRSLRRLREHVGALA